MIVQWREILQRARHPLAITGAGISVASGIPTVTFLWRGIPLREIFTREMFLTHPRQFYDCYREVMLQWRLARPNPAHVALAVGQIPVITMNVDGLHQAAGSSQVIEMHGNLRELVCLECHSLFSSDLSKEADIPHCPACHGRLKPNIVLVGEEVHHFATAVDWMGHADVALIVGTRLQMAPCNTLLEIAKRRGIPCIRINRQAERILPLLVKPT